MAALSATLMIFTLNNINKKRARAVTEAGGEARVVNERGEWNLTEMGDRSPLFKYIL